MADVGSIYQAIFPLNVAMFSPNLGKDSLHGASGILLQQLVIISRVFSWGFTNLICNGWGARPFLNGGRFMFEISYQLGMDRHSKSRKW